jgi:saccharopine dehydrogenase (NAD+, L-lysine-forming)
MTRIGIRAEDKNRWERRAPLVPDHVRELVANQGIEVLVQPSSRRAFSDQDYVEAGARLNDTLEGCGVILGVKEVPVDELLPGRTYVYFPHVTKGQAYNMPMLQRLLDLRCTLLDYELVVDGRGRRLLYFGLHAGYVGMIDALWALGQRLAVEGYYTPLEHIRPALQYADLEEALHHVARIGEHVRHVGLPPGLRPIVVAFTGSGNVSQGAQDVYRRLPVHEIEPSDLLALNEDRDRPRNALFKTVLTRADRYRPIGGGGFDQTGFAQHPERYESALGPLLPHITVLLHGAFWEPGQPVLVTRDHLLALQRDDTPAKLRVIGDVTCDIDGSIAATVRPTDSGDPVYVYDARSGATTGGVEGEGVVVLAVDNLPCELPFDASEFFGDSLVRFVGPLARCDWRAPVAQLNLPPELARAVVVHQGELAPRFRYLQNALSSLERLG